MNWKPIETIIFFIMFTTLVLLDTIYSNNEYFYLNITGSSLNIQKYAVEMTARMIIFLLVSLHFLRKKVSNRWLLL
jgi:negative regulator of genetic competence, sporulation and motility